MISGHDFAYAQARMQSHLGARVAAGAWDGLQAVVEYRAFLEQARATPLRRWLTSVGAGATVHEIERSLRVAWRARGAEIAGWLPPRWRASARWLAVAVELPALEHLLAGGAAPVWMLDDEVLRALAMSDPVARVAVLERGPLAALAPRADVARPLSERWLVEWQARLPRLARARRERLDRLLRSLREHRRALLVSPASRGAAARGVSRPHRGVRVHAARGTRA
jgi:hypothetical protein